jgi:tRNA modification GTPase
MERSTITAISTPPGTGGIGIIKISGCAAFFIGKKIFQKKLSGQPSRDPSSSHPAFEDRFQSHRLYYGHIVDPATNQPIDEVLIVFMKAPFSYTREDIVEIHSHSGHAVLQAILTMVLNCGAQLAEPGEFTRRAFLNGRIDLTQAEAVIDIINAKTRGALDIAASQINGTLKKFILAIRKTLLNVQALCEAFIDFPDDMEVDFKPKETMIQLRDRVEKPLAELIMNYENCHLVREGVRIAIIGKPNVGKSSLMNRLLDKNRVLVTDVPGTTRDLIDENLNIHGISVILTDTAGLHPTDDPVEVMGIQKTDELIKNADLILFMIDSSESIDEKDRLIYQKIKHRKHIVVRNKIDIAKGIDLTRKQQKNEVDISVLKNTGLNKLKTKIAQAVDVETMFQTTCQIVPNLRQKKMIQKAKGYVSDAIFSLKEGVFLELVVIDIKDAIESINQILGISIREDIQRDIFEQFCIGK